MPEQETLTTQELESGTETEEVMSASDIDQLEVSEFHGYDRNPSDYPNQEYFISIDLTTQAGKDVVINTSSSRLENLLNALADKFGSLEDIPKGTLIRQPGESDFDTHYRYEW